MLARTHLAHVTLATILQNYKTFLVDMHNKFSLYNCIPLAAFMRVWNPRNLPVDMQCFKLHCPGLPLYRGMLQYRCAGEERMHAAWATKST